MKATVDGDGRVRALTAEGWSARQIAAEFGVTERTVVRWRVRLGIAQQAVPPLTEAQHEQARRLVADGCSTKEIALTIGCSQKTISKHYPASVWTREQCTEYVRALRMAAA